MPKLKSEFLLSCPPDPDLSLFNPVCAFTPHFSILLHTLAAYMLHTFLISTMCVTCHPSQHLTALGE
jgi:hypothetical protein